MRIPRLDSPYFHPEFARAVHESGTPVHVVVERDEGGVRSLLPGHRVGSVFRPVGWPGADFQAPIARAGRRRRPAPSCCARPACGASSSTTFSRCRASSRGSSAVATRRTSMSPAGSTATSRRASRSGKDNMGQARRKARKARGGARADHVRRRTAPTPGVSDAVIALKRAQYAATGARDYFAAPERVALVHRLLETRVDGFAGVLSTVHVGPKLLAAHFGIRSGGVLHWWFPVYDPQFAAFAPGWILLRELAAAAPALGVTQTRPRSGRRRVQASCEDGRDGGLPGLRHGEPHRARRTRASGRRSSTSRGRHRSHVGVHRAARRRG